MIDDAGWPLTAAVADPLYVGLITDTGRFGYSNTRAQAHRLAAALIEAGVDPAEMSRRLYEEQPLDRLLLTGRALERARPLAGGRMLAAVLTREDFEAAGGDDTEGIVEVMRGVRGVRAAAFVREAGPDGAWRVSLRAADPAVDVSEIARQEGGGGHRRRPASAPGATRTSCSSGSAARSRRGSTATGPRAAMVVAPAAPPALWLVDKPAGPTSHDVVAACAGGSGAAPRSATPARSTPSPPGCS